MGGYGKSGAKVSKMHTVGGMACDIFLNGPMTVYCAKSTPSTRHRLDKPT